MRAITISRQIGGRLLLPLGIMVMAGAMIPLFVSLSPNMRYVAGQLLTPDYVWLLYGPLVLGGAMCMIYYMVRDKSA